MTTADTTTDPVEAETPERKQELAPLDDELVVDGEPVDDVDTKDDEPPSKYKWEDPDLDADSESPWEHERLEFQGDLLAVRKPQMQALGGYQLATSGFMSDEQKTKYTGLFISRHLSGNTWARVMDRLMNPDDPDYDEDTIGALMTEVVELQTGKAKPSNRKARRHLTSQG